MIPRYQRILFWSLLGCIFLMSAFLIHGCQAAHRRLAAFNDTTPIAAPATAATEDVDLYLANDADASIAPTSQQLALPQDPTLRARTVLDDLFSNYSQPASTHPLPGGPAVDDVFLVTLPTARPGTRANPANSSPDETTGSPQLAIVNLHRAFADTHPSGVLVEALTIQSIIGTLHAALPQVKQIRFLVDGQPRETLAGHADLLRTYPAEDTTTKPTPLIEN
jgi:hypothetical protein